MAVKKTASGYEVTDGSNPGLVQYFDLNWGFRGASSTTQSGDRTILQNFDSSWAFVSATVTHTADGRTFVESFDSHWQFQGATVSSVAAGYTTTQHFDAQWAFSFAEVVHTENNRVVREVFDSAWQRQGETVTSTDGSGGTTVQNYDAQWHFTGATVTSVNGNYTTIQNFDSHWALLSAEVDHVDNGRTVREFFNASWQRIEETVTSTTGGRTTVESYDANWHFKGASVSSVSGANTTTQHFDANWAFVGAEVQQTSNGRTTVQSFDASWHFLGATVSHSEGHRLITEAYGASWQFTGATIDTDHIVGSPYVTTHEVYDAGWHLTSWTAYDTTGHVVYSQTYDINHVPTIQGTETAGVTEDQATQGFLHASGALSIVDQDAGQSGFVAQTHKVAAYGVFTLAADGSWTYAADNSQTAIQQLGAGKTLTDSFLATSIDGSASRLVTVTINGVNDTAFITGAATGSVTEDVAVGTDHQLHVAGALAVADADLNEASFQTSVLSAPTNLGHLSIDTAGAYAYAVDNAAVQALGAHDTRTDVFTVSSADGTTQQISIDIHGSQDRPLLDLSNTSGAADQSITLGITVALVDTGSTLSDVEISGVPSSYLLNHGHQAGEGGSWFVPVNQLAGLQLVPVDGTVIASDFTLTVKVASIDGALQAVQSGEIAVHVTPGDVPVATGRLIDGYIAGATVFADTNENGVLDDGEAHTTTNVDGSFNLVGGSGPLVSLGGTDISTGLQFSGILKAPAGSTVITPLTTLALALVAQADDPAVTFEVAAAQVASAFGFSGAINLATYDPVPGAIAGNDPTANAILSAAIQVQSTVAQISAVGGTAGDIFTAIATAVTGATSGGLDLSDTATVHNVVSDSNVTGAAAQVVESTVVAANTSIQAATTVTELAQAGQVAQGATSDKLADLATAIATGSPDAQAISDHITTTYVENLATQVASAVVADPGSVQAGTAGNDVLTGLAGIDTIDGLDGNDTISGNGGNDLLFGGAGKDLLTGGAGDDLLDGGASFDRAVYTDATGGVAINLGAGTASGAGVGTDTLIRIEGAVGSNFADSFDASTFNGSSLLVGTPVGLNEFEGRGGDDVITGRVNDQGAALTRVSYVSATAAVTVDLAAKTADGDASVGHDTFVGNGVGFVFGSAFNDTLLGSNNAFGSVEAFEGRAGNDLINGRGGFDRADYNTDTATASGITVDMASGTVTGDATVGTDTLRSVEAVRGTAFADSYTATGFSGTSLNAGSNGTFNEFTGGGGNDTITGNGATRIAFHTATAGVSVDLQTGAVAGTGTASGDASVGTDTFSGVNAVMGSFYNDTILGSANNDTFTGQAGDDAMDGRGGFDTASYNNIYFVTGGVTINLAAGTATGDASIGNDTLRSIEGIQGTNFADSYNAVGFTASSVNAGSAGVNGLGAAFNQFEGLAGNDTIIGNGNTRLGFFNATGGVTVNIANGTATGDASVGSDTFSGVNGVTGSAFADTITGSNANEFIDGGAGNDTISAGGGSDTLTGGLGNDTIDGGNGADMAVFSGARAQYTVNFSTPAAGQTQVIDTVAGRDGTDALTSVEILQFNNLYAMAATGSLATPVNISGLNFGGNANTLFGTGNSDFLTIGQNLFGHQIDLGVGTDTLNLAVTGGYTLNLANVELLNGTTGGDFVQLTNLTTAMAIDLGGGSDTLVLASGANTISASNIENINGNDFGGVASNDSLTLLNTQNGVTINLGDGVNTVNLAAGSNVLTAAYGIANLNGSSSDDNLTIQSGVGGTTIDLGAGVDTLTLAGSFNNVTVRNVENVVGSSTFDNIVIANTAGTTTVTAGTGNDSITASAATDIVRYVSAADSSSFAQDTIVGFDASHDSLLFDGMYGGANGFAGQVHYVGTGSFTGTPASHKSEARIDTFGGQTVLQIDVDGDGVMGANDMTIQFSALSGTLTDANFNVVVPVNHAPTDIALSHLAVAENSANGTVVGALSAIDQDAGDSATFTLTNDASGLFAISNGNLVVAGALNHEAAASQQITVRVSDGGGNTFDKNFTINVGDVNEAPTNVALSASTVAENSANGTVVGALSAIDPDAGDTSTFTLIDNAGGKFAIDSGNLVVAGALDFETAGSHQVLVRVTDSGGLSYDKALTIGVGNVNEAPTNIALSASSVAENSANGTVIGALSAIDPDAGDSSSFTLIDNAGGKFSVVNGNLVVAGPLDFETASSQQITVRVTDGGGLSYDKNFTIGVSNVNEAPTNITLSAASVAENSANGTVVGVLSSVDPDAGDTATYTLVDNAGGRFAVSNGNLVVAGALDYETATSHQVTVRVSDGASNTFDKVLTIGVTDVPDGTTVNGDANNNALVGTVDVDTINGLAGNDTLQGLAGNDLLDGGAGFDRAVYSDATAGIAFDLASATVTGAGVGTDTLIGIEAFVGTDYADSFTAAGFSGVTGIAGTPIGFNEFEGRGGNDTITGFINSQGASLTRVSYVSATAAVTVDLQAGSATGNSSVGTDAFVGNSIGSVFGSAYADTLLGSNNGFGTVEAFDGRAGNDTINGRGGFDRAEYGNDANTTSGITVNLAAGTVTGDATVGSDTLLSIEAIRGTAFADNFNAVGFSGTSLNAGSNGTFNEFNGGAGNDIIVGNNATRLSYVNSTGPVVLDMQTGATAGTGTATGDASIGTDTFSGVNAVMATAFSDTLSGSTLNDTFTGLAGDDFIDGRGGFDTASYNNIYFATGGVTVNLAAGTASGDASVGNDTLRSIEGVQGTTFADTYNAAGFTASSVNAGTAGVNGAGAAFNQFEGLAGNDTITGNGNTRLIFANATGGVTVNFVNGTASGDASVGTDTFSGVNSVTGSGFADTITGSNGNEIIDAGAGADTVSAGGGSDTITGGAGNDTIDGGGGADMAVFSGARAQYTVNFSTPAVGQTQVIDTVGGRDGTDALTSVEILQFGNMYLMAATGALATPINVAGLNFGGNTNTLFGTGNNDFLTIGQNLFGHLIDLGAGTGDTLTLNSAGGYTLNLANVEILNGSAGDDFVNLTSSVNGIAIDLGGGNDTLSLAGGASTVNMLNVETLQASDFTPGVNVNDAVTLVNNVTNLSVNLGNGNNVLNLAAGANSLANVFGENTINGTAGDDTLTFNAAAYRQMIDLGGGSDSVILAGNADQFYTIGLTNVEHLSSGSGADFVALMNAVNGLSVDLGGGVDTLLLAGSTNTLSLTNVESLQTTDFDPGVNVNDVVTLLNNVTNLTFNFGNGNNVLNLAAGVNSIAGAYGENTIHGSAVDDTLTINAGVYHQIIDLGDGTDSVILAGNLDQYDTIGLVNVEHLSSGSGADFVTLMNTVNGLAVDLGDGIDTLSLAGGANTLSLTHVENLTASDYLPGVNVDDTVTLANNITGLGINLGNGSNAVNLAAGVNSLTNVINVSTVNGSATDDTLTFTGNAFNFTVDLGDGNDTVNFNATAGGVTVNNAETIVASAFDDSITIGNTSGTTTVTGGLGNDYIVASAATDNFRFTSAADSAWGGAQDQVVGFNASADHFVFANMTGGASGFTGPIDFVGTGDFTGADGAHHSEARLDVSGGQTTLQIDVDGDGLMSGNDMAIHLVNYTGTLTSSNFMLT